MGYVHDTAMSQYIPPTAFHPVTGTFTWTAGQVAGTIAMHRAAANETSVINVPIMLPSNSVASKGAYLQSVEFDYECLIGVATSITATMNKVTRGVDGAVAVVASVPVTQDLTAGTDAADVDQHKLTVTVTTPVWIDNDVYYLLVITIVAGAGGQTDDLLGAVANYTLRL